MASIILKDKQATVLLSLRNNQQPWHIASLAEASQATYVHTHNFIKSCAELGLVIIDKHGKIKEIKLTEKGAALADSIAAVYAILNQQQTQPKQEEKKEEKK